MENVKWRKSSRHLQQLRITKWHFQRRHSSCIHRLDLHGSQFAFQIFHSMRHHKSAEQMAPNPITSLYCLLAEAWRCRWCTSSFQKFEQRFAFVYLNCCRLLFSSCRGCKAFEVATKETLKIFENFKIDFELGKVSHQTRKSLRWGTRNKVSINISIKNLLYNFSSPSKVLAWKNFLSLESSCFRCACKTKETIYKWKLIKHVN